MPRRAKVVPSEDSLIAEARSLERKITLLKHSFWSLPKTTNNLVHHRESLARRVEALEAEVERLKEVIGFKNGVLQDEVEFLEQFLGGPASVSHGALQRRVSRLKGAISRFKGGLGDE